MSWNDLDAKQGSTGSGRFVSFKDVESVRIRVLDEEPHTTYVHKMKQIVAGEEVFRTIPATPSLDDDYIQRENGKRFPATAQFNMRVFEYKRDEKDAKKFLDDGEVKILQGGVSIFKQLRTLYQNEGSLSAFDVLITKTGSGRDTEYTVSACPTSKGIDVAVIQGTVESDEALQWANIFPAITAEDQKRMLAEAKMDINYDPALAIAAEMTEEDARKQIFPFGKYKGKTVGEIAIIDTGYMEWAADNVTSNDAVAAACRVLSGMLLNKATEAPQIEAPKAAPKTEAAKPKPAPKKAEPKPAADNTDLIGKITGAFDKEKWEDTLVVLETIKKHGGGKTRLKDLSRPQLESLYAEISE